MQVLQLEPGDLLQIKSTDIPSGTFIKLQAQSPSFLEISDPKAVLEKVLQSYACLTKGDVFTFEYNDQTFDMAVLETRPASEKNAIVVLETDLEVDFTTPVGYEEPKRVSGTSTPRSAAGGLLPAGGLLHSHGTMAQAINYAAIAPGSSTAAAGARAVSSNFLSSGHRLNAKKGSKAPTPQASTPVAGVSTNPRPVTVRRTDGPQALRLAPGKLFFGYEIKPVRKSGDRKEEGQKAPRFQGRGQTLSGRKRKDGEAEEDDSNAKGKAPASLAGGRRLGGGRTPRDAPR
jgi:ubiquitin fusion degradation protein 1